MALANDYLKTKKLSSDNGGKNNETESVLAVVALRLCGVINDGLSTALYGSENRMVVGYS